MRNSPVARTPPKNLPVIPGVTCDSPHKERSKLSNGQKQAAVQPKPAELPVVEIDKGTNRTLFCLPKPPMSTNDGIVFVQLKTRNKKNLNLKWTFKKLTMKRTNPIKM